MIADYSRPACIVSGYFPGTVGGLCADRRIEKTQTWKALRSLGGATIRCGKSGGGRWAYGSEFRFVF